MREASEIHPYKSTGKYGSTRKTSAHENGNPEFHRIAAFADEETE